jgi:outer membrane protein assembly factor BamB
MVTSSIRRPSRILLIVLVVCGPAFLLDVDAQSPAAVTPDAARAAITEAWPAFRGGTAEGRVPRALPTRWSADEGMRWKTAVPGRGYSSPIVFGDRIYLTTADIAEDGWLDNTMRAATIGLMVIVGAFVTVLLAQRCHLAQPPTVRDLVAASGLAAAVFALAIVGSGGDALFDFARCNIRGWLMSVVFASTCVILTVAGTNHASVRAAIGLGMMVLAPFVLIYIPSKDYAFSGGIRALRTQISIASSVIPFLIGCAIVHRARRRRRATDTAPRKVAVAGVVAAVIVAGALLLWHLLVLRDGFPERPYEPFISRWWLLMPGAVFVSTWLVRRRRIASLPVNAVLAWFGGASILLSAVIAVEFLATYAPYLAYQIGEPRLEPTLDPRVLWAAGLAFFVITVIVLYREGKQPALVAAAPRPGGPLPVALGVAALTLASVFFARVNYVSTEPRMFRAIVGLDRQSGDVIWVLRGLEGPQPPIDGRNSPATPTPVTDGTIVCAYFGNPGLMCADADGKLAWSRTDIAYQGFYGVAFSLVLSDGLLIIPNDRADGQALVSALDVKTGATRWTRTFPTRTLITGNNRTPIVRNMNGEKLLIMWGQNYVKALSIRSGEPVWEYPLDSSGDIVSSAISDGERLFLSDSSGTMALDYASLSAGRDPIHWKGPARANCSSPVLANGIVFSVADNGIAAAQDAETGKVLWRQRLPGHYFSSLVASSDAVYFTNSEGVTSVVAAQPTFRLIARNDLQEEVMASMASAGGELYIRSASTLYAVAPVTTPVGTK